MYGFTGRNTRLASLGRFLTDRRTQTDRCCRCSAGLAVSRAGGCALQCASGPSAQTLFLRPQDFSFRRNQHSQWIITRHVVDVGGRSETAEEPPGCKWPSRPVPAQRSCDIESAVEDARPLLISSKPPDVSPSDRIIPTWFAPMALIQHIKGNYCIQQLFVSIPNS